MSILEKKKSRLASMGPSGKLEPKEAAPFAQVLRLNMVQHWEAALDRRTVVPFVPGEIQRAFDFLNDGSHFLSLH